MLKIKLLNEKAELNNFNYVEIKEYIPNLPFKLKIQLFDSETAQRLMADTGASLNFIFQTREGTLVKPGTFMFDPSDKSMWEVSITAAESVDIIGGNFQVVLDFDGSSVEADLSDSDDLKSGMAYNVISKIQFDGEC